jgi:hypothetical protein
MNLAGTSPDIYGLGEGVADTPERRTIPFDYAFRYEREDALQGQPGRTHNQTVTVSIEASFTAVSIGYGVVPTVSPVKFGLLPESLAGGVDENPREVQDFVAELAPSFFEILGPQLRDAGAPLRSALVRSASDKLPPTPRAAIREFAQKSFLRMTVAALAETLGETLSLANPVIGPRTAYALRDGVKFNPELVQRLLLSLDGDAFDSPTLLEAFQAVAAPPDQIQFKYALFDDGSGREFQSEPVLNTAGLGASDGSRPFRYFARPVEFAPRTTIRMQITEVSDFQGELHVSLQGYKTLGGFGTPTSARAAQPGRRRMRR